MAQPIDGGKVSSRAAGAVLLALSALHVAWGLGSTAPFSTTEDLSDAVLGRVPTDDAFVPAPTCFAVAAALTTAASLVVDRPRWPPGVRRLGLGVLGGTLATRGVLGAAGRTDLLVPGSTSDRFRRNDRRSFAPLCLTLSAATAHAWRQARR
jgi:hypothetical protein